MKSLIDSLGFLMAVSIGLALITGMSFATVHFILVPIFHVEVDSYLGRVVFLSYAILWQLAIIYGLITERKK